MSMSFAKTARQVCLLSKTARWTKIAVSPRRCQSTEVAPPPLVDGAEKVYADKIQNIVKEIGSLNLLEVADLNELLKKTLRIQDAPIMAMGAPAAAPKVAEEEVVEVKKTEQTSFTVTLTAFNADKKVALIKELKNLIPGTNLVQAKKFVESCPQVVRADIIKEDADQLKAAIEAAGGTVVVD